MHTKFWLESLNIRDLLEDTGFEGRIILKWILGKWGERVNLINLAQDRDHLQALVNMVMNLRVP
jgi:glutathione synthase/RimK-type ligase-like ATP-grasp enzyme